MNILFTIQFLDEDYLLHRQDDASLPAYYGYLSLRKKVLMVKQVNDSTFLFYYDPTEAADIATLWTGRASLTYKTINEFKK